MAEPRTTFKENEGKIIDTKEADLGKIGALNSLPVFKDRDGREQVRDDDIFFKA